MFHAINYKSFYFTLLYCGPFPKAYSEWRSLLSDFNITVKLMETNRCLENQFKKPIVCFG